jgi:hypothetical protein
MQTKLLRQLRVRLQRLVEFYVRNLSVSVVIHNDETIDYLGCCYRLCRTGCSYFGEIMLLRTYPKLNVRRMLRSGTRPVHHVLKSGCFCTGSRVFPSQHICAHRTRITIASPVGADMILGQGPIFIQTLPRGPSPRNRLGGHPNSVAVQTPPIMLRSPHSSPLNIDKCILVTPLKLRPCNGSGYTDFDFPTPSLRRVHRLRPPEIIVVAKQAHSHSAVAGPWPRRGRAPLAGRAAESSSH